MTNKRPICPIMRDGWGKGKNESFNAIFTAKTPFTEHIEKTFSTTSDLVLLDFFKMD